MLRKELIDLINKNNVWAFIGSGISIDAGLPSWEKLLTSIYDSLTPENQDNIKSNTYFHKYLGNKQFPKCFSLIEKEIGRKSLEKKIRAAFSIKKNNQELYKTISDFPFKGYITTNYDNIIEEILSKQNQHGWITVGNELKEIHKTKGNPEKIVWHIHGSLNQKKSESKLVITEEDYDSIYNGNTHILEHIKSLMSNNRLIFIGFGFNDEEINRILRSIGYICNPTKPAYAFLGIRESDSSRIISEEFSSKYNIELIPYRIFDNSHSQLKNILNVYSPLILKRSQRFGRHNPKCPSYDTETTGLLIYNKLVMSPSTNIENDKLIIITEALILTILKKSGNISIKQLLTKINERINLLKTPQKKTFNDSESTLQKALSHMVENKFIEVSNENIILCEKGLQKIEENQGISERIEDQFESSIKSRTTGLLKDKTEIEKVARAVCEFIKDTIEKRSLGVALALETDENIKKDYHIHALLQSLPKYIELLDTEKEALVLIELIQNILSNPNKQEKIYIGLSIQARFTIHLLSLQKETIQIRLNEFKNNMYIMDSSILIPFIALSDEFHESSVYLINALNSAGCKIIVTPLLLEEISEHLFWALSKIGTDSSTSIEMLKVLNGSSGYKPNAFITGYTNELCKGNVTIFMDYLNRIFVEKGTRHIKNHEIKELIKLQLNKTAIEVKGLSDFAGYKAEYEAEIDHYCNKIEQIRKQYDTFHHIRQVKAEAIALIIINLFRDDLLSMSEKRITNAYFVSNTQIIDRFSKDKRPITIKPDSLLQLMATLDNWSSQELAYLTESLVSEFKEHVFSIVDRKLLVSVFSPFIRASREELTEQMEHYKELFEIRYGANIEKEFKRLDELELPIAWQKTQSQLIEDIQKELEQTQNELKEAKKVKTINLSPRERRGLGRYIEKAKKRKKKQKERINKEKKK
jgi:NAD-dependent SIR2 family protein deacetylase